MGLASSVNTVWLGNERPAWSIMSYVVLTRKTGRNMTEHYTGLSGNDIRDLMEQHIAAIPAATVLERLDLDFPV